MRSVIIPLVALAACQEVEANAAYDPASGQGVHEVRVIDGDTFVLDGETIRIANIDAPESPPRSRCWAEARLAAEATFMLETKAASWVSSPPMIQRQGSDRYGRTLALVSDLPEGIGRDIGEQMIEAGLAVPWVGRRWEWCGPISSDAAGASLLGPKPTAWGALAYGNAAPEN